jgi:glycosyltransferase involved in cell wall biosynthesis
VLGQKPELLINPNDKIQFASRLNELLTNQAKRRQISYWQQQALKQYDIDVVGEQIINLYNSAIARLNKKRHN